LSIRSRLGSSFDESVSFGHQHPVIIGRNTDPFFNPTELDHMLLVPHTVSLVNGGSLLLQSVNGAAFYAEITDFVRY
jgi:hypothetical protein